jgi:hypothetical protein
LNHVQNDKDHDGDIEGGTVHDIPDFLSPSNVRHILPLVGNLSFDDKLLQVDPFNHSRSLAPRFFLLSSCVLQEEHTDEEV